MSKIKIAIFASGSGSNAENIINYFKSHPKIEIAFVMCNNPKAGVIERVHKLGIQTIVTNNHLVEDSSYLLEICKNVSYIVLAGYLRLIPERFIQSFENKIFNIHPALLPKYGGKGMYGDFVHQKVLENKDTESGISIHLVNEEFDKGAILAQYKCPIDIKKGIEGIKQSVQELEHQFYPLEIERKILKN